MSTGFCPGIGKLREGAHIGKQCGEKGCAAVRLINILDPGEIFVKELWAAASPPRLNFAYGFIGADDGNKRYWSYTLHGGSYGKWDLVTRLLSMMWPMHLWRAAWGTPAWRQRSVHHMIRA